MSWPALANQFACSGGSHLGLEVVRVMLRSAPLANFNTVRNIVLRVKQGAVLHLMEPRPAFPPLGR